MIRRLFLLVLLLATVGSAMAQTWLYPVRQQHKWGFITARGKMQISPKYDAVGDIQLAWSSSRRFMGKSPYRLVDADQKVGLLGPDLREVLPCIYKRIRPLSNRYFAVEMDSLFTVVNRAGEIVVDGRYDDIRNVDTTLFGESEFFMVKQGLRWGIHRKRGELVVPAKYMVLEPAYDRSFFKVKIMGKDTISAWGLINEKNEQLLPYEFEDILVFRPDFIVVKPKKDYWHQIDLQKMKLKEEAWNYINPLNKHLLSISYGPENQQKLWNHDLQKFVGSNVKGLSYLPFNENYSIVRAWSNWGLIDSTGTELVKPAFDSIRASGLPGLFAVSKGRLWGIQRLEPDSGFVKVLDFRYARLGFFKDSLAICQTVNGQYGLLDTDFKEILPAMYAGIEREGDTIKALTPTRVVFFTRMDDGSMSLSDEYSNVKTIRIGKGLMKVYQEAPMEAPGRSKPLPERQRVFVHTLPDRDSTYFWTHDYTGHTWGLRKRSTDTTTVNVLPNIYTSAIPVLPRKIIGVYLQERPVTTAFARRFGDLKGNLSRMALYSFEKKQFITPFQFLGIRIADFEEGLPYAAFVDTAGRMGLIDRRGEILKKPDGSALRFSYIGRFSKGQARVCSGGTLMPLEDFRDEKFCLNTAQHIAAEFCLRQSDPELSEQFSSKALCLLDTIGTSYPLWGYIDLKGNITDKPKYQYANDYQSDSVAVVVQKRLYGAINIRHELILDTIYKSLSWYYGYFKVSVPNPYLFYFNQQGQQICTVGYTRFAGFSGGFCAVRKDSLWGYINGKGDEVVPCRYKVANAFSDSLAAVLEDNRWVFINPRGEKVFETALQNKDAAKIGRFSEGLCAFQDGPLWGFYNKSGAVVIAPTYHQVSAFKKQVSTVRLRSKFGIIDTSGKFVLEPKRFEEMGPFNAFGVAVVREKPGEPAGLINQKGVLLTPLKYKRIRPFKDGFAVVLGPNGYGLLSAAGKEIIPAEFAEMGELSEGLVAVLPKYPKSWIYMDTLGRRTMSRSFNEATPFRNGYAVVNRFEIIARNGEKIAKPPLKMLFFTEGVFGMAEKDGQLFSDATGDNLFGRWYEEIDSFENGIAKVKKNGRWGAINSRGVFVVQPKFNFIHPQNDGNIIVRPPVLFGLADPKGKIVLEPKYDRLDRMRGGIFRVEFGEQVGYFREDETWLWGLQF